MSGSVALDIEDGTPAGGLRAWLVCFSVGLFFFYEFFQLNVFDVINKPLRLAFNVDAAELSWLSSSYLWANILFLFPAGVILDRFSVKKVVLTALSVCIVGTAGFALTYSFSWAFFFHFLTGIGNAFCFLSCVVLVSRWFLPRRQAFVIGTLVTMAFIGGAMAHTPFAHLSDAVGWRNALLIDAAVGVVFWIWIVAIAKDFPDSARPKAQPESQPLLASFLKASGNPQNLLAGFYTGLLNLPIMVLCALWGVSYLQVVHQLSELAASNVVSLIFFGSMIGCPLFGWLSDRQGQRKPFMYIGAIVSLLVLLPFFTGVALSEIQLSVLFFALGFFTSSQVISYPLVAESNFAELTGAATGAASLLIMGGGALGQLFFGWLMRWHAGGSIQIYAAKDYQFAMWMFPLAVILALAAVLLIRETFCKRQS